MATAAKRQRRSLGYSPYADKVKVRIKDAHHYRLHVRTPNVWQKAMISYLCSENKKLTRYLRYDPFKT